MTRRMSTKLPRPSTNNLWLVLWNDRGLRYRLTETSEGGRKDRYDTHPYVRLGPIDPALFASNEVAAHAIATAHGVDLFRSDTWPIPAR